MFTAEVDWLALHVRTSMATLLATVSARLQPQPGGGGDAWLALNVRLAERWSVSVIGIGPPTTGTRGRCSRRRRRRLEVASFPTMPQLAFRWRSSTQPCLQFAAGLRHDARAVVPAPSPGTVEIHLLGCG